MTVPQNLEQIAMRAFPATTDHQLGQWVLRWDAALPNRRVNSAWDLGTPGLAPTEAVEFVRKWYRDRGGRPTIKTEPGSEVDLLLTSWATQAPTGVHTRETGALPTEGISFLDRDRLDDWCSAFVEVRGLPTSRVEGLVASYRRLPTPTALALAYEDSVPVAAGLGVPDGDLIGLFDIATRPDRRRQGWAKRITEALVGWGYDRGAKTSYLQVEEENRGAQALYSALGFTRRYGYHYRVDDRPGEPD